MPRRESPLEVGVAAGFGRGTETHGYCSDHAYVGSLSVRPWFGLRPVRALQLSVRATFQPLGLNQCAVPAGRTYTQTLEGTRSSVGVLATLDLRALFEPANERQRAWQLRPVVGVGFEFDVRLDQHARVAPTVDGIFFAPVSDQLGFDGVAVPAFLGVDLTLSETVSLGLRAEVAYVQYLRIRSARVDARGGALPVAHLDGGTDDIASFAGLDLRVRVP